MPTLQQLEAGIVAADAAGDAEGVRILGAELKRMRQSQPDTADTYSPADATTGENFAAGMGVPFARAGRALTDIPAIVRGNVAEKQQANEAAAEMEAPLRATTAGAAGEMIGGAAMYTPFALAPGAATLPGAALWGGAGGFLTTPGPPEERLAAALTGGVGGGAGMAVGRGIPLAMRDLSAPFREGGRKAMAGRTLNRFAGDPQSAAAAAAAMETPDILVPGSMPTAAEASGNAGISQLQRSMQNINTQPFTERTLDQNAARVQAIRRVAGDDASRTAAVNAREAATAPLYGAAKATDVPIDDELRELLNRPVVRSALAEVQTNAANRGQSIVIPTAEDIAAGAPGTISGEAMHSLKMALDDSLSTGPQRGIGAEQAGSVRQARDAVLGWLEQRIPDYSRARTTYAAQSAPINQMDVGTELLDASTRAQMPNTRGDFTLYPSSYGNALKRDEGLVKKATGRDLGPISKVMDPDQMATIEAVKADLARTANMQEGKAIGSNTGQNFVSQDIMRQLLGPLGLPEKWSESVLLGTLLGRPTQWALNRAEPKIQEMLIEALLNPQIGARYMQQLQKTPTDLAQALLRYGGAIPGATGTAIGSAYAPQQ